MKKVYLLNLSELEEFNKKIKLYNKLLAKKHLLNQENNKELLESINVCKSYIKELLSNDSFDYLEDIDISIVKDKFNEENTIRDLLNKNYLNSNEVQLLIDKLEEEKEDYSELIRFLRISIKKNLALVMFYE
ncbi:hypothetical protein H9660_13035 [Clostridium sp. Sa3CUN1]|uniref:Uncharacterized protein n=1 Tax=Clostridium gallinarum TaxID=2762246 RepID=A0ABR8Q6K8_9CLOT|nr:hypothetical protein [Clostridium gallinarum]MBD7916072.1 hypothetical protein [Clostridium gallinarum]